MLRSPLRWVGGKSKLREHILKCFPEHVCYVELFAGAAWVLFGKDPATSKSEVLNDRDGELINFWRVVKHRPAEFAETAGALLASRDLFDEWKKMPAHVCEVERAARFYAVIRIAYGAKRVNNHFGMRPEKRPELHWPLLKEEVAKIVARLRVVWIENKPWEKCVADYDRKATFFYVDPPYRTVSSKSYRHFFSDEDHERLADVLLNRVKGKWLLSYNDDPLIRRLYRRSGVQIERLGVNYSLQGGGSWLRAGELLIRNY